MIAMISSHSQETDAFLRALMTVDSDLTTTIIVSGWQTGKQETARQYMETAQREWEEFVICGECELVDCYPDNMRADVWFRREKVKWPVKEYPKPVQSRLLKRKRFYSGFVSEARGRHLVVKLNNSRK